MFKVLRYILEMSNEKMLVCLVPCVVQWGPEGNSHKFWIGMCREGS